MGGKLHLKLNICLRPIANKYHEGKMKRTLKRELKVPEIAGREVSWTSAAWRDWRTLLAIRLLVIALLLALSVRTSSRVDETFHVCRFCFGGGSRVTGFTYGLYWNARLFCRCPRCRRLMPGVGF